MRVRVLVYTVAYAGAIFAAALQPAQAQAAAPTAASALGRWYRSLPGWGCYAPPYPAAYQVKLPIGPEVDAFAGPATSSAAFTDAPLDDGLTRIGAIYDPALRTALFKEHGQDRGSYALVANATTPPVAVKQRNLATLSMGGKVHLGDTLENVRIELGEPGLRLTTMSSCAFPQAAAYAAATVYGPPHHPALSATEVFCRETGPDIKRGQTLGTIVFRADRVVVLIWNYEACSV